LASKNDKANEKFYCKKKERGVNAALSQRENMKKVKCILNSVKRESFSALIHFTVKLYNAIV